MSIKKELTMKAAAEIFKLASRIGIKPRDIIGQGADVIKMGKSLFNTKVNPKLTEFISKKGEVPTKILEEIKIHLRSLKNASDDQIELLKINLKEIVSAKSPVSSVKQPVTSVKEPAAEAFKGWKPTVIKGGKDPKFNEGGMAKLNAELNQLPEYYLPMEKGGISNHFRKKFDDGSDETGVKLYPRASIIQGGETVGPNEDIDVDVRDVDYGITGLYEGNNWFAGAEIDKGNVKVDVTQEGDTLFKDTMGKDEVINFIAGFGDPNDEKFQIKVDDDFENVSIVLLKSFAKGGIANHFRTR